jgi:sulfur carrier protein
MSGAATQTIEIVVNGHPRRVPQGLNIEDLLKFLEIDASRVAVELNREIVRRPEWSTTVIANDANIEIVWFVGGGSDRPAGCPRDVTA